MKLLRCDKCGGLVQLTHKEWRTCACKCVGGQYNLDLDTVTVYTTNTNNSRVIGVPNNLITGQANNCACWIISWSNRKIFRAPKQDYGQYIPRLVCLKCGMMLQSTSRHDFKECNCSNKAFIDGGYDYIRYGAVDMNKVKLITLSQGKEQ